MRQKLTKRIVETAAPPTGKERLLLWDTELKGFGVAITAAGSRSYFVEYKQGGRNRRMTLGKHGAITLEQARKKATVEKAKVLDGKDPLQEKQDKRDALTVNAFFQVYLERHSKVFKKPRSVADDLYLYDKEIKKPLGSRKLDSLTRGDVTAWHQRLKDTPYTGNRCLSLLSKMLSCAEEWGFIAAHPARRVKKHKEQARQRYLSGDELKRLAAVLQDVEASGFVTVKEEDGSERKEKVSSASVNAIRLLIFSGMRKGEALSLRWSEVDLENKVLQLEDSKTGRKTIYLMAPAVELLSSIQATGDFVFPSPVKNGKPLVNIQKPWKWIVEAAGIDNVRLHDLRHTFASIAAGLGLSLPIIGALLGHGQAQTTQRYAHLVDDPQRQAVDSIGEAIHAAMTGKVVEMAPKEEARKVGTDG